jgi:hypothetical protein
MLGAVPGVVLKQPWRRVDEEREERAIGFGDVESALERAPRGARVTERVVRDRLEQGRRQYPYRMDSKGTVQDGRDRDLRPCGSCWASRSTAMAVRISPPSRS